MSSPADLAVHIEPLLHLAAITVAITIAYIGLDEVRWEADRFYEGLVDVQESTKQKLQQNDLWSGGQVPVSSNALSLYPDRLQFQILVLCFVANVPFEKKQIGLRHCLSRQRYVPMLSYFRDRFDRTIVTWLATLSMLMFFYLTAVTMWDLKWFPGDSAKWISTTNIAIFWYWACAAIIIWISITVAVSHKLQKVGPTCELFLRNFDDHVKRIYEDAVKKVTNHPPAPNNP